MSWEACNCGCGCPGVVFRKGVYNSVLAFAGSETMEGMDEEFVILR